MSFSDELANLNNQLAARKCKARVEQRKNSLVLRATLPPKPGCSGGSRQQRIPLGLPAVLASLAEAELKALTLNTELRQGTFEWRIWLPSEKGIDSTVITRSVFEETARRLHSEKYAKAPERGVEAWRKRWATALNKLPADGEITRQRLVAAIERLAPATSVRRETGLVWGLRWVGAQW